MTEDEKKLCRNFMKSWDTITLVAAMKIAQDKGDMEFHGLLCDEGKRRMQEVDAKAK